MAETANFVIQYLADISNVKKQLREVEKVNKTTGTNLTKNFTSATDIISRRIKSIRSKPVFDKTLGRNVIKTFAEVETVFKGTDGKLKTMTQNSVLANGKLKTLNSTVRDGATSAKGFGANLATLAKRALLTIPVWLALRSSILGVIRGLQDGAKALIDFDRALQKARRNLQGSSDEISSNFSKLRKETTALALETGESTITLTNAFQKFATVGFDFETSMKGATDATKLAVLLFGNAEETANAFARSMRVLVDNSEGAIAPSEQIAKAIAQTAKLWETNAFEIGEFTQSLEKFAGTARTTNITTQETITLLATLSTAGLRAGRGGTLLRTSIQKLIVHLDELAGTLGVKVNPKLDTTFDVLLRVTDAIGKLSKQSKLAPEATEAIAEIFGGVRGAEPVRALIALNKELKENLKITGDIVEFNEDYKEVLDTLSRQTQRFSTLRVEMNKAFVEGFTGGEKFKDSLKGINSFLERMIPTMQELGLSFQSVFNPLRPFEFRFQLAEEAQKEISVLLDQIQKGLKGELKIADIVEVVGKIQTAVDAEKFDPGLGKRVVQQLKDEIQKQVNAQPAPEVKTQLAVNLGINPQALTEINNLILKNQLERLKAQGATNSQIQKAEILLRKQLDIKGNELEQLERELNLEREINEERRLRNELSSETVKLFRIAQTQGVDIAKQIGDVLAGRVDFSNFVRVGGEALDVFKKQFGNIFEQQQALAFFKGDTVPGAKGLRGGAGVSIREEAIRTPISTIRATASIQQRELANALRDLKIQEQTVQAGIVNINTTGNIETLRTLFKAGEPITGPSARLLVGETVKEARRIIDLNLTLDGRNFDFQGTPEAVRTLAQQITNDPNVLSALENQIINALDNPQSKISKGIDQKIENF
jgi:TP901 family phage tail tape measure protein